MNSVDQTLAVIYSAPATNRKLRGFDFDDVRQEAALETWRDYTEVATPQAMGATMLRFRRMELNAKATRVKRGAGKPTMQVMEHDAIESSGVLEGLCDAEDAAALWAQVDKLYHTQARAIRMRFIDGLSYEEIAVEMGCSVAAVGGHMKRALKALREVFCG